MARKCTAIAVSKKTGLTHWRYHHDNQHHHFSERPLLLTVETAFICHADLPSASFQTVDFIIEGIEEYTGRDDHIR